MSAEGWVTWFPAMKYSWEKVIINHQLLCYHPARFLFFHDERLKEEKIGLGKAMSRHTFLIWLWICSCFKNYSEHLASLLIRKSMFYSLDLWVRKNECIVVCHMIRIHCNSNCLQELDTTSCCLWWVFACECMWYSQQQLFSWRIWNHT